MSRRQKILVLVHPKFRPDRRGARSRTEIDVWRGLRRAGFVCEVSAVQASLKDLDRDLARLRPHAVFNLLEEFRDEAVFDFHAVSYLEACGVPYTGCNPRGLIVSRNKIWASHLAAFANIPIPQTFTPDEKRLQLPEHYPVILKLNNEHASMGLSHSNIVRTPALFRKRWKTISDRFDSQIVVQQFIDGREVSVSVIGNESPSALPPRELRLRSPKDIATERVKFNSTYRRQNKIRAQDFSGPESLKTKLRESAVRGFKLLGLSGYARFDFRLRASGDFFLIDVNANPNLERTEDFAVSARRSGVEYEDLLRRIVSLARGYRPQI